MSSVDSTIVVSGNTASVTITLPSTVAANKGLSIFILNNSASPVVATCHAEGDSIDGSDSVRIATQYSNAEFYLATTNLWTEK